MMTKLRHVVTIRATRKIKPKSFVHKLYLKCLHLQEDKANNAEGPQVFFVHMLDDNTVAIDLIITDELEDRDPSFINLEHTRELSEEEIHIYNKDFIKHLGVHLTKDRSKYIEKWTI